MGSTQIYLGMGSSRRLVGRLEDDGTVYPVQEQWETPRAIGSVTTEGTVYGVDGLLVGQADADGGVRAPSAYKDAGRCSYGRVLLPSSQEVGEVEGDRQAHAAAALLLLPDLSRLWERDTPNGRRSGLLDAVVTGLDLLATAHNASPSTQVQNDLADGMSTSDELPGQPAGGSHPSLEPAVARATRAPD